jgi:hypothetical protein
MRRGSIILAVLLLGLVPCFAIDLPKPPDGFAWHAVQAIKGAILVPNGWHFSEESGKGTFAFFITEDEFTPPARFRTGINITALLGNPSAAAQMAKFVRAQAEHYHVEVSSGTLGTFKTLQCQYDPARTPEHEAIRVALLSVFNPDTGAVYLVAFNSPIASWGESWPKGQVVLKTLVLNAKV